MKSTLLLVIANIVVVLLLTTGCFKKDSYPNQPIITYNDFKTNGDSATLSINFTDGDGDIGLNDTDTSSPYQYGSAYYYNFIIVYYEKDDVLGWIPGKDAYNDTIVFNYRIHPFTDLKKPKALKGIIETLIEPIYYNPYSSQSDTIRYNIQLIDRALNKSEWLQTPTIIR